MSPKMATRIMWHAHSSLFVLPDASLIVYPQLCNEDYQWWWRSFLSAGSSGGYLFLYSIWYFASKLSIEGLVPTVLYFSYMAMVSITFFLLTGSIGFFACLWFVRKIYGAIKVD
jgi:transmembrane 9 superfamily protein 2/4